MRGKPLIFLVRKNEFRNIPAYAGKTRGNQWRYDAPTEHPRVCGENTLVEAGPIVVQGTSPRMRGKPVQALL